MVYGDTFRSQTLSLVFTLVFFLLLLSESSLTYAQHGEEVHPFPEKGDKRSVYLSEEEQAWLDAHPDIEFGYTDAFEPAVIVNEDGTYRGTLVDFLALLNERLGTDFTITVGPIAETFNRVSRRELAGILSLHPDNADKRGFLKTEEYMFSYPTVYTQKGVTFTAPADLAGKKIAIIDNVYFSQNIVDLYGDGSAVFTVESALEGLERVKDGTVDLFVGSSRNSYLLVKYQFFDLVAAFQFYKHPTPNVMGVRNDWPQLVSILNKGLASISAEEVEAIRRKWLHVPEQKVTKNLTGEERDWLKANPTIKVGLFPLPPYTFVKNGRNQGYLVELMQLLAGQAGFTPDFSMQALPETLAKVKSGQLHAVLGIMRNEERADYTYFSENVLQLQMGIFARASRSDIRDAASLKNKIIATRKDYGFEHVIKKYLPDAKIIRAEDAEGMLQLVASGEADAAIRELHSGEFILQNSFINNVNVKGFFTPPGLPETTGAEFAVSKKFPLLNSILNKAYNAIPESEKIKVWRKWFVRVESQDKTIELTPEEQAWLDQNHTVRVRLAKWPPYLIINENQPPEGISIEYLKLIAKRTGVNFEYQVTSQPFAEFLESMKQRQGPDMTPVIAQSSEREQYISFTDPYIYAPWVIFAREQQELLLDISALNNKVVAVPRGFIMQKMLEKDYPQIRLALFDNDKQALLAVSSGNADAYVGHLTVASHMLSKHGLSNLQVVASTPYGEQVLSMGNRSDWPELTSIINKALASITEEEKTAMRNKYIAVQYKQGVERDELIKWVVIVVVIVLFILLMFTLWNWQLRSRVQARTAELEAEIVERKQAEEKIVQYQGQLKALASQLTVVEGTERRRIAAGLHDHIGQILAFSRIQLSKAQKLTSDDKQIILLDAISQSMLQVIEDTRALIFDLSSPLLNEIGLDAAITDWLENRVKREYGLHYSFSQEDLAVDLNDLEKNILFRNFKELVVNVIKHAQATSIDVQMRRKENQLHLRVTDNGLGYDPEQFEIKTNSKGGFGLFSIHERMADIGGKLSVVSEVGSGCSATLVIPINTQETETAR